MTTPKTHPCDTCKGTGRIYRCPNATRPKFCPVCLGAGSLPDKMPALDAVADAETLLRNDARVRAHAWAAVPASFEARMYPPLCADPEIGAMSARLHARAAFRACPGLRSE